MQNPTMKTLIPLAAATLMAGCSMHQKAELPLTGFATAPVIVSPTEWGSNPRAFADGYEHTPRAVLIHHAGVTWKTGPEPATRLRNLQTWGANERGWADVPYHYLIAPNGDIYEGRNVQYRPDTNTNFDTTGFINVHLWGNFEEQRVSRQQLEASAKLTAWLLDHHNVNDVLTHRDAAPGQTTCPGRDLYRYFENGSFGHWVGDYRAGFTPVIELAAALPNGPEEMIPLE